MKKITLILMLIFCFASYAQAQSNNLFAKAKQKNWVFVLNDKSLKINDLFNFENEILKISGGSTGYVRTAKKYKNFTLTVEYRWMGAAANSGVLVYIQDKDTVWPSCYQVQQKVNAVGDIICMNGVNAAELTDTVKFTVPKQKQPNEKPVGEWNKIKIVCRNGAMQVFVNDELQNSISGMSVSKGYIGFQAEGKPLEFKNLIISK
ncbi:MAG: DUF1080 domain-containing protein [Paludibacter sp.]|nr:DUF1080 domain-containing protein [Paludibacter sp.]